MSSIFARKIAKVSAMLKAMGVELTNETLVSLQSSVANNIQAGASDLVLMRQMARSFIEDSDALSGYVKADGTLDFAVGTRKATAEAFVVAMLEACGAYDAVADAAIVAAWAGKVRAGVKPANVMAEFINKQLNRPDGVEVANPYQQARIDNLKGLMSSSAEEGWVIIDAGVVELVDSTGVSVVNEGQTVRFTLIDRSMTDGEQVPFSISGVSSEDVEGANPLSGRVTFVRGKAFVEVQLKNDNFTEGQESLTLTVGGRTYTVAVNDTSTDQEHLLTASLDNFTGDNKGTFDNNVYVGTVSSGDGGVLTTYQPNDAIDGGEGSNTLRLTMDAGTLADGVSVANIQTLDLRVNATLQPGSDTRVVMSDWDESLEQINIRSNKSNVILSEQQSVADVAISDQSTANETSSYTLGYAAGVLDGENDHLNLSVDNVNGSGGSTVSIDAGMESLAIEVADRAGEQYASHINLESAGTQALTVTGGRSGQGFVLAANVAVGADLQASAFNGAMNLTSGTIQTAVLGAGNDHVTISGLANDAGASFDLGEGNNQFTLAGEDDLAGEVKAGAGNDVVYAYGTDTGSSVQLGEGNNTLDVYETIAGDVTAGSGDDVVEAGLTAVGSSISLGAGDNNVAVGGVHDGSIETGAGADVVAVGSTGGDASIEAGSGNNLVQVEGHHAGDIVVAAGDDTVLVGGTTTQGSLIALGDGQNQVNVIGHHAGAITGGSGMDWVVIGSDAQMVPLTPDEPVLTGSIETGAGEDGVWVRGDTYGATINVGEGDGNVVAILGNVVDTDVTVGDGNNNVVAVAGTVSAELPGTISFGDGFGNQLQIQGALVGDRVEMGDGQGNSFSIGEDVANGATIELGDGGNSGYVGHAVHTGSSIVFGAGTDELTLGSEFGGVTPIVSGIDVASVVDMGDGDDQLTIHAAGEDGFSPDVVQSGALIRGGEGNDDTLTIRAAGDVSLVARTQNQQVTIDFSQETFTLGQVVTVTLTRGDERIEVSYTVTEDDFIQGPDALATVVAGRIESALNSSDAFDALFGASDSDGVVTIVSDQPLTDFSFTSSVGTVDVVQISDARISGFETIELVALDSFGEDHTDVDADFALIDGAQHIVLDSQVERVFIETWDGFEQAPGGVTTFTLSNLHGGESIEVSGHETGDWGEPDSGTGNVQVQRITVGAVNDLHRIGDQITVSIGDAQVTYVVTAEDLAGDTASEDAANIAQSVASAIESAVQAANLSMTRDGRDITLTANEPGVSTAVSVAHTRTLVQTTGQNSLFVAGTLPSPGTIASWDLHVALNDLVEGDIITVNLGDATASYVVTQEDCQRMYADAIAADIANQLGGDVYAAWGVVHFGANPVALVDVSRTTQPEVDGSTTSATETQVATSTDDAVADVVINATLAEGATDTTMDLTVAGEGAFDLRLEGEGDFTGMDLTLADEYSHTINTNAQITSSLVVSDAEGIDTAGQTIALQNVLAAHVDTTASAAHFTIDQYAVRGENDAFVGETITVNTGAGNDHLTTLAQSAMGSDSQIDLGAGDNRLSLGWGDGVVVGRPEELDVYGGLESVGNINFSGELQQLDILNAVELPADTVMTMPGGVGGVEVVTFIDVETSDENNVATDLTVVGAANSLRIETRDDFELGVQLPATVSIGSNPYTSNITWDITPSDDGVTTPFTDALTSPGADVAEEVLAGHRIKGATPLPGFVPGYTIDVPPSFSGYGDDAVDDEQFEVYHGTYDAETGIFTVTLTRHGNAPYPPEPGSAPTHTLVLYDNDPSVNGTVEYVEGFVVAGFFQEQGWFVDGLNNVLSFDEEGGNYLYVPYTDPAMAAAGGGTEVGVLTVQDANGEQITGDLEIDSGDDVAFNLGNQQLETLTVAAGDNVDVFILGNEGATFNVGAVHLSSTGNEGLNLHLSENDSTTISIGEVMLTDLGEGDGASPNLIVSRNTDSAVTLGDVSLETGYVDEHDYGVEVEANVRSTVTMGAVSFGYGEAGFSAGDADANLAIARNQETDVQIASVTADSECYAELEVLNNTDSNVTVTGDVHLAGTYWANLAVEGNRETNVSLAADGLVSMSNCSDDVNVTIADNVNAHVPADGGPDQGVFQARSYSITLGDLAMDAGGGEDGARLDIVHNSDDTYYGDLTVSVGNVDQVSYTDATIFVSDNDASTIEIGDVTQLARNQAIVEINDNDGQYYTFVPPGMDEQYELDEATVTVGDVDMTADLTRLDVEYNDLASVTVGDVRMTAHVNDARVFIYDNDANNWGGSDDIHETLSVTLGDVEMNAETAAAWVEITDNDARGVDSSASVTLGAVDLSANGRASVDVIDNDATDLRDAVSVDVGLVSLTSVNDHAYVYVTQNSASGSDSSVAVRIEGVDANAADAERMAALALRDNDATNDSAAVVLELGDVALSAGGDVYVDISENDADGSDASVSILLGDLDLSSGSDASVTVEYNDAGWWSDSVSIELGTVSLSATGNADFDLMDNNANDSDASVRIDVDGVDMSAQEGNARFDIYGNEAGGYYSDDYASVTITVATAEGADASVVMDAGSDASFYIYQNDANGEDSSVSITLDNVDMSAGADANFAISDNDVNGGFSDGSLVDITLGTVDIAASDDVYFGIFTNNGADVELSDVTIDAGNDAVFYVDGWDSSSTTLGDITVTAGLDADAAEAGTVWSDVYFYLDDVDGTESVTIEAVSSADADGDVYGRFEELSDLNTVTVSGTNAELYFFGEMGSEADEVFTLDLSGMTGTFEDGATYYDPEGSNQTPEDNIDDGTYVVNVDANFGADDVLVKIGSGDLIYNAQHSSFGPMGEDNGDWYYDGANDSYDWFGDEGWYSLGDGLDLTPVRQVQTLQFSTADAEDGEWSVFDVQVEGRTYEIRVNTTVSGGDNDEGGFTGSGSLGGTGIYYSVSGSYTDEPGDTGYSYGTATVTFTGPEDGSAFTLSGITDFSGGIFGSVYSNNITTVGVRATDGLGNDAGETFQFVGDGIGEVVIGGFRPNGFFEQSEVDRLDFSMFSDIADAGDLIISIEQGGSVGDSYGYFDDVIIDFVNDDYGSIRLVGVGEYFTDANVNGIANSIVFG